MSRKTIAIITELIPVASAILSFIMLTVPNDPWIVKQIIPISFFLAFLGFVFFFVGRKLAGNDVMVRVIGVMDWLATLSIVVIYILAIFSFGL